MSSVRIQPIPRQCRIVAHAAMVRGLFVDINDLCCWRLVKWGGREYAEGSKSRYKPKKFTDLVREAARKYGVSSPIGQSDLQRDPVS